MSSNRSGGLSGQDALLRHERLLRIAGRVHIAGIDEAGRGPLAGPVVAAAVIFPEECFLHGVRDSKQLTAERRDELYGAILSHALGVGVGIVGHEVIDRINILNATFLAMHQAVDKLPLRPDHLLIDGNRFQDPGIPYTTIVKGDARCFSIAAASIVAKVTRDRLMTDYDGRFPGYGFARHKGYATQEHCEAIARLGMCEIHRRSFHLKSQMHLAFTS
jgi:ribonuclease HII